MPVSRGMSRAEAAVVMGVPVSAHRNEVLAAFRAGARLCHPDTGGDPDEFGRLVCARDILLRDRRATPTPPVTFVRRRHLARDRRRRQLAAIARRLGLRTPTRVR